jgi:SAM-dependent methyltransferase
VKKNEAVFKAYSRYYDLLYRDKDYAAEVAYIHALLRNHGLAEGELLEFGCGTGKHGRLLAEHEYRVHGIERSAEMVAQAKPSSGFTCQQGDICDIQLGRTYDAVLALFHVVSYQTSNDEVKKVFASASAHLESGGIFIFDIWYSPAVYAQRPTVRIKRIADETIEITRIAEPLSLVNENRVDVNYTIFVKDRKSGEVQSLVETHPMRHFSLPELDLLAEANGFERVAAEEFLTGESPSEKTWGVCITMKRT